MVSTLVMLREWLVANVAKGPMLTFDPVNKTTMIETPWPNGEKSFFVGEPEAGLRTPYCVLEPVALNWTRDSKDRLDEDGIDLQVFNTTAMTALQMLEGLIAVIEAVELQYWDNSEGPVVGFERSQPALNQEDRNLFRASVSLQFRVQRPRKDV